MGNDRKVWPGLIAIEGIDGAGTTTLTRLLGESLKKRKIPHELTKEPTDGPVGRIIRQALAGKFAFNPRTLALLFAADRQEHLWGPGGIKTSLDAGRLVITDRYFFSSLAYQSLGTPYEWVDELNSPYPLPSHIIFLTLPVEEAQKRLEHREERDIFEESGLQKTVSEHYQRALDQYGDCGPILLRLDGGRPPEELREASLKFLGVTG